MAWCDNHLNSPSPTRVGATAALLLATIVGAQVRSYQSARLISFQRNASRRKASAIGGAKRDAEVAAKRAKLAEDTLAEAARKLETANERVRMLEDAMADQVDAQVEATILSRMKRAASRLQKRESRASVSTFVKAMMNRSTLPTETQGTARKNAPPSAIPSTSFTADESEVLDRSFEVVELDDDKRPRNTYAKGVSFTSHRVEANI